jgi:GAF domain-containing protein
MQPVPEIRSQFARLSALLDRDRDVGAYLRAVADVAQGLVPSCVGVSITLLIDGDPYTVTATSLETVELDAVQNLEGGPCVEAVERLEKVELPDVLDEARWQYFAQAAAARGIRSSLSFPIRDVDDQVVGGMNLYASEPDAFADQRFMEVGFGADLAEVVANADLGFRTRQFARELPERLAARETLDLAVGVMMARRGWTDERARAQLERAGELAGIPKETVADIVMSMEGGGSAGR